MALVTCQCAFPLGTLARINCAFRSWDQLSSSVLSYVCSPLCSHLCALLCVLSFVCSCMCVLLCARICVLSPGCASRGCFSDHSCLIAAPQSLSLCRGQTRANGCESSNFWYHFVTNGQLGLPFCNQVDVGFCQIVRSARWGRHSVLTK